MTSGAALRTVPAAALNRIGQLEYGLVLHGEVIILGDANRS